MAIELTEKPQQTELRTPVPVVGTPEAHHYIEVGAYFLYRQVCRYDNPRWWINPRDQKRNYYEAMENLLTKGIIKR